MNVNPLHGVSGAVDHSALGTQAFTSFPIRIRASPSPGIWLGVQTLLLASSDRRY